MAHSYLIQQPSEIKDKFKGQRFKVKGTRSKVQGKRRKEKG
ncbi:hypothetical protein D1AOALGA4SA_1793 [Olavius algarvensis Delta 1 endosymbiont]|nr:hypothetical protein D1AOALGA4SA_1793 [Olavius algarvensis Delta 1 endosymbiont]